MGQNHPPTKLWTVTSLGPFCSTCYKSTRINHEQNKIHIIARFDCCYGVARCHDHIGAWFISWLFHSLGWVPFRPSHLTFSIGNCQLCAPTSCKCDIVCLHLGCFFCLASVTFVTFSWVLPFWLPLSPLVLPDLCSHLWFVCFCHGWFHCCWYPLPFPGLGFSIFGVLNITFDGTDFHQSWFDLWLFLSYFGCVLRICNVAFYLESKGLYPIFILSNCSLKVMVLADDFVEKKNLHSISSSRELPPNALQDASLWNQPKIAANYQKYIKTIK